MDALSLLAATASGGGNNGGDGGASATRKRGEHETASPSFRGTGATASASQQQQHLQLHQQLQAMAAEDRHMRALQEARESAILQAYHQQQQQQQQQQHQQQQQQQHQQQQQQQQQQQRELQLLAAAGISPALLHDLSPHQRQQLLEIQAQQQQQQQQSGYGNAEAWHVQEALQREVLQRELLRQQQMEDAQKQELANGRRMTEASSAAAVQKADAGRSTGAPTSGAAKVAQRNTKASSAKNKDSTSSSSSTAAAATAAHQHLLAQAQQTETEYLQQLRLEALVQQRRQETLAQLALAQEMGLSGAATAGMQSELLAMLEAEQQQQQQQTQSAQYQLQLRQAALLRQEALMNGNSGGADGGGAPAPGGNSSDGGGLFGAYGGSQQQHLEEARILNLLQERDRQRQLEALLQLHHIQSAQAQADAARSGSERSDLIGSVFANKGAPAGSAPALDEQRLLEHHRHQQLLSQMAAADAAASAQDATVQQREYELERNRQLQQMQHQDLHRHLTQADLDDSKTTILPCRARGMPMDHNVKTAYFVIPEDIKHGTELVCSYYACRNAGIKFRYCVYCKLPVAKRNFAKRHRHTGKIASGDMPKDMEEADVEDGLPTSPGSKVKREKVLAGKKSYKVKKAAATAASAGAAAAAVLAASSSSLSAAAAAPSAHALLGQLMAQNVKELEGTNGQPQQQPFSHDVLAKLVRKQQANWDALLMKRPKSTNSSDMLTWIQEVLRVSDMEEAAAGAAATADSVNVKSEEGSAPKPAAITKDSPTKNGHPKKRTLESAIKDDADAARRASEESIKVDAAGMDVSDRSGKDAENGKEKEEDEEKESGEEEMDGDDDDDHDDKAAQPSLDDASTSSEDSVDLRASKKPRV